MRDLFKLLLVVGMVFCFVPNAGAESYKVLIIPDNIVTESVSLDSYIYNDSAEFFSDEIATILNQTDYIKAPSVSETRALYKKDPYSMLAAKNLTSRFRTSYNVDFLTLKKLAAKSNSRYVLLITSYVDSENYILRRTVWDFLNIAGATVVDPAYKISTYAVLVDTNTNSKLWSDTYYKTISVCENRIITRGASPQTEQLQKIKDYSRILCPEIAQNVQVKVLPASVFAKESNQIYYDIGNIDNVFTKKYRHLGKEYDKVYTQRKADFDNAVDKTKTKVNETKTKIKEANEDRKARKLEEKKEVKAKPIFDESQIDIKTKTKEKTENIKNAIFKKKIAEPEPVIEPIEIKQVRKNKLYGSYDSDRPDLRDYN